MKRGTKPTAEQIVNVLRHVEVGGANGKTLPHACVHSALIIPGAATSLVRRPMMQGRCGC